MATPPQLRNTYLSAGTDGFQGTTNTKTATVSWTAGDFLVLVAGVEDAVEDVNAGPTLTDDLSATVTFTPRQTGGTASSSCRARLWTATTTNAGTGRTLSATISGGGNINWGYRLFVYYNTNGYDNSSIGNVTLSSGAVGLNLQRNTDNCAVVAGLFEYSATSDITVTTAPVGGSQDNANTLSTKYTYFVFHWDDQGTAATTSYGLTAGAGTNFEIVTCSIAGVPGAPVADSATYRVITSPRLV